MEEDPRKDLETSKMLAEGWPENIYIKPEARI